MKKGRRKFDVREEYFVRTPATRSPARPLCSQNPRQSAVSDACTEDTFSVTAASTSDREPAGRDGRLGEQAGRALARPRRMGNPPRRQEVDNPPQCLHFHLVVFLAFILPRRLKPAASLPPLLTDSHRLRSSRHSPSPSASQARMRLPSRPLHFNQRTPRRHLVPSQVHHLHSPLDPPRPGRIAPGRRPPSSHRQLLARAPFLIRVVQHDQLWPLRRVDKRRPRWCRQSRPLVGPEG